ncbi:MAG: 16S rRNA (uracil(1498)-N(3))-methyltransferase [Hyphomicrobiales bacterium]
MEAARLPRLYVAPLPGPGDTSRLDAKQAHYLTVVLRRKSGDRFLAFNEAQGEWLAELEQVRKHDWALRIVEQRKPPQALPDVWYLFAPLKHERLDYLAQKITEMGACRAIPVLTDHAQRQTLNLDRLKANMIEAAEQCELVGIPSLEPPQPLDAVLARWPKDRALVWCNEDRRDTGPLDDLGRVPAGPVALLIGPEGGFSEAERARLSALPFVHPLGLGPRVLRADTAAVAALALIQAVLGDWRR